MPTRKQDPETREFRQGAYASSAEFEHGILGNLVAARCQKLTDPEEIAMLWWLQQASWRDGGLEKFTQDLLSACPDLIGTAAMHCFGMKPGKFYSADQVRVIRDEIVGDGRDSFPLRGEMKASIWVRLMDTDRAKEEREKAQNLAPTHPEKYPVEAFQKVCRLSANGLADLFRQAMVDPQSKSLRGGIWFAPSLWDALWNLRETERKTARARIVETAISRQVFEELDFAYETRSFVQIEGREGIGKSDAARCWCDQRPGQAVYVRLESGSDETTLYRSIAREIGTACSYQRKAVEMRARIQDALQSGHLMLVLDEAHFLWPTSARSERATPKRLDWLRTALIDFGVPIALVSTPQFFTQQCDRFRKAGWNANQIQRRLTRLVRLPESLTKDDVLAVVGRYFPNIPVRTAKEIAGVALFSIGYLTTIVSLRKRFDFLRVRRPLIGDAELLREILDEKSIELGLAMQPANEPAAAALQPVCRKPLEAIKDRANVPARLPEQPVLSVV